MSERHRSPPGTYVRILKSAIEDPKLSADDGWLLMWLATKPTDWEIYTRQVAGETGRSVKQVQRGLTRLRRLGYVQMIRARAEGGTFTGHPSRLRCDRVLAGHDQCTEYCPLALTSQNTEFPQVSTTGQKTTGWSAVLHSEYRPVVSNDFESEESQRRPSSDGPPTQDPHQKITEQIITACLAASAQLLTGDGRDPAVVAWLQRTFTLDKPHPPAAFAAYLARCIWHAREQMHDLVTLKADDDGYYFTEDAAQLLSEVRKRAAGTQLPTRWEPGVIEMITGAAAARARPGMTARQATEAGIKLRWKG